jgi:hypothetical protein
LADGVIVLGEEFAEEEGDGGQGAGFGQDHAETPGGQSGDLGAAEVGKGVGHFAGPLLQSLGAIG